MAQIARRLQIAQMFFVLIVDRSLLIAQMAQILRRFQIPQMCLVLAAHC